MSARLVSLRGLLGRSLALVFLTVCGQLWVARHCLGRVTCVQSSESVPCGLERPSILDGWIDAQANKSWPGLLANIGPRGVLPGLVVASLSASHPDYYYTWTRDAATILREVVTRFEETNDPQLLCLIKQSIASTQIVQRYDWEAGSNLGEPKNFVNGTPFTGLWWRPQRDGPALRAILYIKFATIYLDRGGEDAQAYVRNTLYDAFPISRSVIKADLDYVSNTWQSISFDLWEEVKGHHLFTFLVMLRAMKDGATFSNDLGDTEASAWYAQQANLIEARLMMFWDDQNQFLRSTVNFTDDFGKTTWIDSSVILGSLLAGNQAPAEFRPNSTMMLSTFNLLLQSMSQLYPLNQRYEKLTAKAIGRYPEDLYDGVDVSQGNPWFLTTLALAEYQFRLQSPTTCTDLSPESLGQESDTTGRWPRSVAYEFVDIVRASAYRNGSLHEQFDRVNGKPTGARDLTWSHFAFLSMVRARDGAPEF